MPAVVRASYYGGSASEPAGVSAEGGIKFNRADDQTATTAPIPIPSAAGTNFSWIKNLALEVTTIFASNLSNRRIKLASAAATGLEAHYKVAAYAQPASGNKPTDDGTTNGVDPAGYTALTTSDATYDASSVSANSLGRNGAMMQVVLGVSGNYAGGASSNAAVPSLTLTYDEA